MDPKSIEDIYQLEDIDIHQGVDASALAELEGQNRFHLPRMHQKVLQQSNGIEAYGGYLRLFGLSAGRAIDLIRWNQHDYWKFSWGDRCSKYWCFGETAWGDQYAYSLESLCSKNEPEVYFMDALSMTPEVIASSFTEFWEKEFVRSAKEPYDIILKQARGKLGRIGLEFHLVYAPSLLLGGTETIDNVHKMNARAAMVCNGDIALQLDSGPADRAVKGVQQYEDDFQRVRIRLVWT